MIAIIDYGMGNIHSVKKAFESLGAETAVVSKPKDLKNCQKIVLPGVGAFSDAMAELKKHDMLSAIKEQIDSKKAFLGICLGMQLLFEQSQEAGETKGLMVLEGKVKKFPRKDGLKVPHMGWNQLKVNPECPLLKGIADYSYVYFCHSYYPEPKNKEDIAATCEYGVDFCALTWRDNIYGTQFHPEKSQAVGIKMLKNFIQLC